MRRIFLSILFLSGSPAALHALFEFKEAGAAGGALAGAYAARTSDALSPFWNPAGLRSLNSFSLSTFYSRPFSLEELSYTGSAAAFPTPAGAFGFAYSRYGNSLYREQESSLSHAFGLSQNVDFGYNLKLMHLKIEEFGSAAAFAADAGMNARLSQNLRLALVAKNVNRPRIGASRLPLPSGYALGAAWHPVAGLLLNEELECVDSLPPLLKSGVEFSLSPRFVLRGGFQNLSSKYAGGMSFKAGGAGFDYGYQFHPALSGTHLISLHISFAPPREENFALRREDVPTVAVSTMVKLNLETATEKELDAVPLIGASTAKSIVDYRSRFGIKTMDDLLKVPKMRRGVFFSLKERSYVPPPRDWIAHEYIESPLKAALIPYASSDTLKVPQENGEGPPPSTFRSIFRRRKKTPAAAP